MPSMAMEPRAGSRRRRMAERSELLPLPLRPQIPIFSPGWMVRLMSARMPVAFAWSAPRLQISTRPRLGQSLGTDVGTHGRGSDGVWSTNPRVRAIAPRETSSCVQNCRRTARISLKLRMLLSDKPSEAVCV